MISVGTSSILDQKTAIMTAVVASVDLGGVDRAFAVTGQLSIGTNAAPIPLTNGGVVKNGTGKPDRDRLPNLNLAHHQRRQSRSARPPPPPSPAFGEAGSAAPVPEPGVLSLLALGALGALGRRRRV